MTRRGRASPRRTRPFRGSFARAGAHAIERGAAPSRARIRGRLAAAVSTHLRRLGGMTKLADGRPSRARGGRQQAELLGLMLKKMDASRAREAAALRGQLARTQADAQAATLMVARLRKELFAAHQAAQHAQHESKLAAALLKVRTSELAAEAAAARRAQAEADERLAESEARARSPHPAGCLPPTRSRRRRSRSCRQGRFRFWSKRRTGPRKRRQRRRVRRRRTLAARKRARSAAHTWRRKP